VESNFHAKPAKVAALHPLRRASVYSTRGGKHEVHFLRTLKTTIVLDVDSNADAQKQKYKWFALTRRLGIAQV